MTGIHYVAAHLVKRALEIPGEDEQDPQRKLFLNVSGPGAALISLTILAAAVIILCIRYTLWGVVATLAYVEKEQNDLDLDPPAYAEDAELPPIKQIAITSRIRQTIRHLQTIGGFWSRWRGAGCAICFQLAFMAISGVLTGTLNAITFGKIPYLDQIIGSMIASLALAHWQTAWTHIVISEPSPKRWIQRVPAWKWTIKNIWLATAVHELASRLAFVAPMSMVFGMNMTAPAEHHVGAFVGKAIAVLIVSLILTILIVIPSGVTLTRVQASMLPEEDETIVPFDRSFSGKVEPAIVGGSGAISFVDAWKTFDRHARTRVVKLLAKIVLVEIALHLVFGAILGVEFAIFVKGDTQSPPQM